MNQSAPLQRSLALPPSPVALAYDSLADWMKTASWYIDQRVYELLRQEIPPAASRGLDLCCGTGATLSQISLRRWDELTGVDISARMVELARAATANRQNTRVLLGDWIEPVLNGSTFDFVLVKNALHLLDEPTARLIELPRITSASATLVIIETVSPNKAANEFVRRLFGVTDTGKIKRHLFTSRSLRETIKASGWRFVRSTKIEQRIDVRDWLEHKSATPEILAEAREVIRESSPDIRRAMQFAPEDSIFPETMLRLQEVFVCHQVSERERGDQLEFDVGP